MDVDNMCFNSFFSVLVHKLKLKYMILTFYSQLCDHCNRLKDSMLDNFFLSYDHIHNNYYKYYFFYYNKEEN